MWFSVLGMFALNTIVHFILEKVLNIKPETVQAFAAEIGKVANEKIDGLNKKSAVVDRLGDKAQEVVEEHGAWAMNVMIELLVMLLKKSEEATNR